MRQILNILIACEESQAECYAFRDLGHNAYSCDIQQCRKGGCPDWHIQGDATPYLRGETRFVTQSGKAVDVGQWDLIIAHPPCTYLCRVSGQHLYKEPTTACVIDGRVIEANWSRIKLLKEGRRFFYECLNAEAHYVAVENPVPLKLANLPRPSCYAEPSWYGVRYTKKTCYWLRNLPPLMPECEHPSPKCYVTCSRGKYRSRTFPQMARAIARQWSEYILTDINKEA